MKDTPARKVRRFNPRRGHHLETLDLTDELVEKISNLNGYLPPAAVRRALEDGHAVHTSFSAYELID